MKQQLLLISTSSFRPILKKVTFSRQRVRDVLKEFFFDLVCDVITEQGGSLKALLDLGDPVVSSRSTVCTQQVISLDCLEFEETPFLRFFRSTWGVVAFNDSGDLREVDVVSTLEVLTRVVVSQLMLGRVQHEPALLPTLDAEICLKGEIKFGWNYLKHMSNGKLRYKITRKGFFFYG